MEKVSIENIKITSGSPIMNTLEQLEREARLIEYDPRIVKRYISLEKTDIS